MKFDKPVNSSYAAQVVKVNAIIPLPGLDNLVGIPTLGHQALTQKDKSVGDLAIAFTCETQLSDEYSKLNNLYRDATLNKDPDAVGYLEKHRRIKAIKLRGHRSDALLMPLESIAFTGVNPAELKEGDTFDRLNGHEICKKYEIPVKATRAEKKVAKIFRRVDSKLLPEHVDTENYFRNAHMIPADQGIIVTAKQHGTSVRISNTIVKRRLNWFEKLARRLGVTVDEHEYDYVHGSRKVIKNPGNEKSQHFYGFDLWTREGEKLRGSLPLGTIVYGELIGWAENGKPIQKGYDYSHPNGECSLLVYRVARISPDGFLTDLSWDQVKEFCKVRGLKHVVELWRGQHSDFNTDDWMEKRYFDMGFTDCPQISNPKLVDEGVVIRVEGVIPSLYKCKAASFLRHESGLLDQGEADMESAA